MTGKYILRGKLAVPIDDLMTWGRWMQSANRRVCSEEVGDYMVSTVFLGLDHGFGNDLPILFETMIFAGSCSDIWMDRCGTWEEAIDMHERGVAHALALLRQLPVVRSDHD